MILRSENLNILCHDKHNALNMKYFKVTRKGGNQAILYFNDDVSIALLEYFEKRQQINAAQKDENAFFLSLQKS